MSKHEDIDDLHISTSINTPIRKDAFDLSDDEKIDKIEKSLTEVLHTLGLDLTDDSLKDTPKRVAKMFVKEIFKGLNPKAHPRMSTFENKFKYGEMLVEKDIGVYSTCEHHFLPIIGRAHIAYISSGRIIGLSKLNRIVNYYAKRPQVQERLTKQIVNDLQKVLDTDDVACVINAKHMCVITRGIEDAHSSTVTAEYGGKFKDPLVKREFLDYIQMELGDEI
jgi:GTP cyclohydrolase I